jgi:protein O-mannosyl-transferase
MSMESYPSHPSYPSCSSHPSHPPRRAAGVALGLTLLTFLTFLPVLRCGFSEFDDPDYVTANSHVLGGLTVADLRWAWTSDRVGYWQPLSWMSLMLDTTLFGPGPEGYHRTNVALHALSAGVVFLVLSRLTGTFWRSALVAALYAVHPLRVESVAWVAERKDVLSNLLAWLTIGGYIAYASSPSAKRYLLVLIPFVLGLLAKPMIVTLPCLLLLLDYWPLKRTGIRRLLLEKLPMFLLAGAAALATMKAQERCQALVSWARYPGPARIGTMLVGYVTYMRKMVWFDDLSVFYPLPTSWPWRRVLVGAAAGGLLAAITALAIWRRKDRPWLLVGWLWFLGVMAPVSGIFQAGPQALADRFSYLPSVGLLIMLVWSIPVPRTDPARWRAGLAAAAVVALLCAATRVQAGYWRDNRTLFSHALAIDEGNWIAHDQIGESDYRRGDYAAAMSECRKALAQNPIDPVAHTNLGLALEQQGRDDEAIVHFRAALAERFNIGLVHNSLGVALERKGDLMGAYEQCRLAVQLSPEDESAHSNLGGILLRVGLKSQAIAELRQAVRLNPLDKAAQFKLARAMELKDSAVADTGR